MFKEIKNMWSLYYKQLKWLYGIVKDGYGRLMHPRHSLISYELSKILSNKNDKKLYFDALERLNRGEESITITLETCGEITLSRVGKSREEFLKEMGF